MSAWKLVPVEPTEEMKKAGIDVAPMTLIEQQPVGVRRRESRNTDECADVYRAMLSASPDPATDEALVKRVCDTIVDNEHLPLREFAIILIRAMEEKP